MPIYWGDYLRDTEHLRTLEHGAYLLLIGRYWCSGTPLPDDDDRLRLITKTTTKQWRRMKAVVMAFFQLRDGRWWHGRLERELKPYVGRPKAQPAPEIKMHELRPLSASKSGPSSGKKPNDFYARGARATPSPLPNQSTGESESLNAARAQCNRSKTMVPKNWQPTSPALEQWAMLKMISPTELTAEAEHFVAHHRSNASLSADWDYAFKSWWAKCPQFRRPGYANGAIRHDAIRRGLDEFTAAILRTPPNGQSTRPGDRNALPKPAELEDP